MKLTKLFMLGLASTTLVGLTACPKAPEANAAELEAVEKVMKGTVLSESSAGNPIAPDTPTDLEGYKNTSLTLTKQVTKKVGGEKKTVNIEWSYDSALETYVRKLGALDNEHDRLKFKYGHVGVDADGNVVADDFQTSQFTLKAVATCGAATLEKTYVVNLKHNDNIYDEMTIAQLYAENEAHNNYHFMKDGDIQGNHGQKHYYCKVTGKLEYLSPDGNWGLLSDGNHVIEVYQLTKSTDFDACEVGKYLTVYADIAQYVGNIQLSYCNFMEQPASAPGVTPLAEYGEMPETMNLPSGAQYVTFHAGINNQIGTLTGVTVKSGEFASFNKGARFTFTVTKGTQDFVIAYDYHVAAGGAAVGDEFDSVIKSLQVGSVINVKGTIRYSNEAGVTDGGEYQLTPFRSGDLVKVS